MITYKIDLVKALEDAGYSTYRIRQEKIMGAGYAPKHAERRNDWNACLG